ncbi:MAG: hypothetical protein KatS3mg045_2069 [Bellilinea sp.]|nr:MAG: hypothetical protein KatS3mg045_2069 [Bellilinea sp.]
MGYDVHIAFAFPNDQQIRRRIESIAEVLRSATVNPHGRLPYFEALGAGFFKKRVQTYRLLAYGYGLNEVPWPTVLFVDLIHRNDPDYDPNPDILKTRYGTRIQQYCVNIRNTRPDDAVVARPLQSLPDQLRAYLQPVTLSDRSHMVYLSDEVMRAYQEFGTVERGDLITGIGDIINSGEVSLQELQERFSRNCGIIHERFLDPDTKYQHEIIWGAYSQTWPDAKKDKLRQRIQTLRNRFLLDYHKAVDSSARCDVLSRYANRAFPWYIMADSRLRDQVFEEREAFLALSTEESHLLEQTLVTAVLPLLIEGRAGSGKSTVLTYHVAERTAQLAWEHGDTQRRILFVTQSEKLLTDARRLIDQLIHRIVKEKSQGERTDQTGRQIAYLTYHEFALNQLPPERRSRFASRRRQTSGGWIDFSRFRDLMRSDVADGLRSPASKRIQPEAAWFVLRSYIKGYKIYETGDDRWLTPEEYVDTVPRGDRQVSLDLYEEVWKEIWPWYRRLTLEPEDRTGLPRYWDDLDLAWEVRHYRAEEAPTYAAVVCDEVQDLSRIELATLLEALEWFRYNLDEWEFGGQLKLPVIFAGDSHQTVNPASFRWQRVGADLTSAISFHVPRAKPVVTTSPLRCNYRNSPGIAKLANAIQKLRQEKLGAVGELQTIWRLPDPVPNQRVRFVLLDNASDSAGINELLDTGVLFIGPDDDDPSLQSAYPFWCRLGLTEIVPRENYVIPSEIKGLEQDFVAVFGFGTYFALLNLHDFWNWSPATLEQLSEDLWFRAEYFLNNLYVAVSRARDHLWIVETEEGWRAFWEPLRRYVETAVPDETAEYGCFWAAGSIAELIEISKANWPRLASSLQALAERDRDPDLAERAAFYYRLAGMPFDERRMLAFAVYYRGYPSKAAQQILSDNPQQAVQWWWEARDWRKLAEVRDIPDYRIDIAELMLAIASPENTSQSRQLDLAVTLADFTLRTYKQPPSSTLVFTDPARDTWLDVAETILSVLENATPDPNSAPANAFTALAEGMVPLISDSARQQKWHERLATVYYNTGRYHEAIRHWDIVGTNDHERYFLARAWTSQYPECLRWYDSAKKHLTIIELYEQQPNVDLSNDHLRRVGRAYAAERQWEKAFLILAGVDRDIIASLWHLAMNDLRHDPGRVYHLLERMHDATKRRLAADNEWRKEWSRQLTEIVLRECHRIPQQEGMGSSQRTASHETNLPETATRAVAKGATYVRNCLLAAYGFSLECDTRQVPIRLRQEFRKLRSKATPPTDKSDSKLHRTPFGRAVRMILLAAGHYLRQSIGTREYLTATRYLALVFDTVWTDRRTTQRALLEAPNDSSSALRTSHATKKPDHDFVMNILPQEYLYPIDTSTQGSVSARNTAYTWQGLDRLGHSAVKYFVAAISAGNSLWTRSHAHVLHNQVRFENIQKLTKQIIADLNYFKAELETDTKHADAVSKAWRDMRWLTLVKLVHGCATETEVLRFCELLKGVFSSLNMQTDKIDAARDRILSGTKIMHKKSAGPTMAERSVSKLHVTVGEECRSSLLRVKNLSIRQEAVLEFNKEGYRVRFMLPSNETGDPVIYADPEISVVDICDTPDKTSWRVEQGGKNFRIDYRKSERTIEVHADRLFVVSFRRQQEENAAGSGRKS